MLDINCTSPMGSLKKGIGTHEVKLPRQNSPHLAGSYSFFWGPLRMEKEGAPGWCVFSQGFWPWIFRTSLNHHQWPWDFHGFLGLFLVSTKKTYPFREPSIFCFRKNRVVFAHILRPPCCIEARIVHDMRVSTSIEGSKSIGKNLRGILTFDFA